MGSSPGGDKPKTGSCCFSDRHAASRSKNKDWLARNQDNVSECMSTPRLSFQCTPGKRDGLNIMLRPSRLPGVSELAL